MVEDGEGCRVIAALDERGALGVVARYEGELARWCFGSTVWMEVMLVAPGAAAVLASRLGAPDVSAALDLLPGLCGGEDAFDYIEMLLEECPCSSSLRLLDGDEGYILTFAQVGEEPGFPQTFLKFLLDAWGGP